MFLSSAHSFRYWSGHGRHRAVENKRLQVRLHLGVRRPLPLWQRLLVATVDAILIESPFAIIFLELEAVPATHGRETVLLLLHSALRLRGGLAPPNQSRYAVLGLQVPTPSC